MKRRVLAVAAAAATALAILPATPAFASAAASASLAPEGADVLAGTPETLAVTVTNTEPRGLTAGRTINTVRVILPSNVGIKTAATPPVLEGWDVVRTSSNGLEQYIYKAKSGGIAAASLTGAAGSFTFPVPVTVARPSLGDRLGNIQVSVSSDGGSTFQKAGDLATTVRSLRVTALSISGPSALVTDGTGTEGQKITARTVVQNLALNSQSVTPAFTSDGNEQFGASTPTSAAIPAGSSTAFTVPVTLGSVDTDTLRKFAASASSTRSDSGPFGRELPYTVQTVPLLTLDAGSFLPAAIRKGETYTFTVDAAKVGSPTLRVTGGSLSFSRVVDGQTVTLAGPAVSATSFGAGDGAGALTSVGFTLPTGAVDGTYDVTYTLTGTDGNGFAPTPLVANPSLTDALDIDNLGPVVDAVLQLPADRDGDQTTAVRNYNEADGNELVLTGSVDDAAAAAPTNGVGLQCLNLVGAAGFLAPDEFTRTGTGFEAVFRKAFPAGCSRIAPAATFVDPAGNPGTAPVTDTFAVDNVVPTLTGVEGAVVNVPQVDPAKPSIEVNIADKQQGVIGGCDPRNYSVDGQFLVQAVYVLEDGEYRECTFGTAGSRAEADPVNNTRYLRVSQEITRGGDTPEPTVTYDPARTGNLGSVAVSDRIKDAAGNYAPMGWQDTVTRLVPDAPTLVEVLRNDGKETAVFDEERYWTRFAGTDLVVTVAGGLDTDRLRVVRKSDGKTVAEVGVVDGEASTPVELLTTKDVVQEFDLLFVSERGVAGLVEPLRVVLDQTAPALQSTRRGGSEATVTFREPVLGDNAAIDWSVFEMVENEAQTGFDRAFRGANSVTGAREVRTIAADFTEAENRYGGAQYIFMNARYEDRAGNLLPTTALVLATTTP